MKSEEVLAVEYAYEQIYKIQAELQALTNRLYGISVELGSKVRKHDPVLAAADELARQFAQDSLQVIQGAGRKTVDKVSIPDTQVEINLDL